VNKDSIMYTSYILVWR